MKTEILCKKYRRLVIVQSSFYGWYYRIQSDTDTLAMIPAYHKNGDKGFCSIQMITEENSWQVAFPYEELKKSGRHIQIGLNQFGERGINLKLQTEELTAFGKLQFGPFTHIRYDIMGPFRYIPFMECYHTIRSMKHLVNGHLKINQTEYNFENAIGYMEGDHGRSFPKHYAWTQCFFPEGSLILSVAEIPLYAFKFTGIIAVVMWQGKEYRFATYLGAKVLRIQSGEVIIKQGRWKLSAKLHEQHGKPLLAPVDGNMIRTIHEHVICRASYHFQIDGETVFQFTTNRAAFEYEYY